MGFDRPKKRIALVDAGVRPLVLERILPLIADRYELVRTSARDADYVFHSCRGYDVLKYPGVRIFATEENVSPDFNISDYALAYDHMEFGDRYCRLPLYKLYPDANAALHSPRPPAAETLAQKSGFCAYVMSNMSNSAPERIRIFEALSKHKPVHSGGRWRNNVGGPVADKIAFQSRYKFVIACENTSFPGYLTEKFAQAAQSNAVPIYWGDPTIGEQFNPKAFVNCHDFASPEAVAEEVARLDADDQAYLEMLSQPWFPGGVEPPCLKDEFFASFLANIFDQPIEAAYRRNRGRWGIKREKELGIMYGAPPIQALVMLRKRWRKTYRSVFPKKPKAVG